MDIAIPSLSHSRRIPNVTIRGNRVSPQTLSGYCEPCAIVTHLATFAINNPVMIGTKGRDVTVGSTFNK